MKKYQDCKLIYAGMSQTAVQQKIMEEINVFQDKGYEVEIQFTVEASNNYILIMAYKNV